MRLEQIVAKLVDKVERRFYGKYRGFVVENADPEQLGRLKLRVPSVLGDAVVTGWALPCVPYGGEANQGMLFIPEVNAGVWVEFEEGDLEFPIWVGTFWSKPGGTSELPVPNRPDGAQDSAVQDPPTRKIIKTLKGHTIQFEDKDNEEMVTLVEATNGHVMTMSRDGVKITEANRNRIEMTQNGTTITDANGHRVTLHPQGVTITDGVNSGNQIVMGAQGVTLHISGNTIILGASGVQLGSESAAEPLVLGNQFLTQMTSLLTQLSTHTHVGNLGAPTSPPVAPLQFQGPQTLSTRHKLDA